MPQEKEGRFGTRLLDPGIEDVDVGDHPKKPVPVRVVPQKAPFAGIINRKIGGFTVPPLIRRPNLKTFPAEPPGQPVVPEGVFRHAMDYMYHSLGTPRRGFRKPTPRKKLCSVIGHYPLIRFIHNWDSTPYVLVFAIMV